MLNNIFDLVKFYIRKLNNLIEVWAKLEALYGTVDEDMAYTIEDKTSQVES